MGAFKFHRLDDPKSLMFPGFNETLPSGFCNECAVSGEPAEGALALLTPDTSWFPALASCPLEGRSYFPRGLSLSISTGQAVPKLFQEALI